MSFNVVAWSQSEDEAGAYAGKAAVPDELTTTSGDILYVPEKTLYLIGAYGALEAMICIMAILFTGLHSSKGCSPASGRAARSAITWLIFSE